MTRLMAWTLATVIALVFAVTVTRVSPWNATAPAPDDREEVVFWHFWGGADRDTVEEIVRRFNASQTDYFVSAIAMPGSNLDLKLFLAVAGGNPPDVVNQDDPIIADWASRNAITKLSDLADEAEMAELRQWLFPAACKLGEFEGALYGLCNGLDVRALYYNATMLEQYKLAPPKTIEQLDLIANTVAPPSESAIASPQFQRFGFLPNPRNLWCWGVVFGGKFYDESSHGLTLDNPGVVSALDWMAGYGRRYGTAAVTFRAKDQSLPGKTFPLLADRYAAVVDGQWRIRDIESYRAARLFEGRTPNEFGVCPLPYPQDGSQNAGWINGNFFVVPAGAQQKRGAWEFMKFWSGFGGNESEAARTCAAGGWIPVSQAVADQSEFQSHLQKQPLWNCFIELAASARQLPRPNIRSAAMLDREVRYVAETAMYDAEEKSASALLQAAQRRFETARAR